MTKVMDITGSFQKDSFLIKESNHISSIFTIMNSTVGVTILFMPKILLKTGFLLGIIELTIFAIFTYITTRILSEAGEKLKINTYYELGEKILPSKGSFVFIGFYFLILLGNILVY